jgi:hypothetical protein
MRKFVISSVLAFTAVVLTAGSAWAFECYNASRSANGNAHAAKSKALQSIPEILADPEVVGLCPAGVQHVVNGLQAQGFRTDVLINFHALMAGGVEKKGDPKGLLHNGRGIDHLGDDFFAAADPLIGQGFGICAD